MELRLQYRVINHCFDFFMQHRNVHVICLASLLAIAVKVQKVQGTGKKKGLGQ